MCFDDPKARWVLTMNKCRSLAVLKTQLYQTFSVLRDDIPFEDFMYLLIVYSHARPQLLTTIQVSVVVALDMSPVVSPVNNYLTAFERC